MGSLRPSEILSHSSQEDNPTNCLQAQDLKRLKVRVDGQETVIVQLTLKKTSKTLPYQAVEIPETGIFVCLVQALDAWVGTRKAKPSQAFPQSLSEGYTIQNLAASLPVCALGNILSSWSV